MLVCLRVRDFAIIEALEVELGEGLNVVTGETGAGKSILVDALQLVLGAKGRPDVVRTGKSRAEVEAAFDFGDDAEMRARLEAAGIDADGELIIRRVVQSTGRSRAYINGRLATASQLAHLAAGLADISSQHEHHSLVEPASHLRYLDAFGRLEPQRDEVARAYGALCRAAEQLAEVEQRAKDRVEREDLLRWQTTEIDELAPEPGEKDALLEERERLRHADYLARAAGGAEEALYADDGALCESLATIAHEVQEAGRVDPHLDALAAQLVEARTQLEDAARELGGYARSVTVDPERLAEVEDRLERMNRLERKHGGSIDAVLA
ncbi:MAG: AAA family ATPase, partial [Polyangiales bacterium]